MLDGELEASCEEVCRTEHEIWLCLLVGFACLCPIGPWGSKKLVAYPVFIKVNLDQDGVESFKWKYFMEKLEFSLGYTN